MRKQIAAKERAEIVTWLEYDEEGELFTEASAAALRESGVTDYCSQVCGGGNCGGEGLCQYGIDSKTHMPPETEPSVGSECGKEATSLIAYPGSAGS